MTAAPLYDYDFYEAYDLTSYISVRHGKYRYDLTPRSTEIAGTDKKAYGGREPASDAIGEALRAGKKRCTCCQQFKEPEQFSPWTDKKTGKTYYKTKCNACRWKLDKAKHMSELEIPSPILPVQHSGMKTVQKLDIAH